MDILTTEKLTGFNRLSVYPNEILDIFPNKIIDQAKSRLDANIQTSNLAFQKTLEKGLDHWIIMYSGGKDATATLLLAIEFAKRNSGVRRIDVIYSDTKVEENIFNSVIDDIQSKKLVILDLPSPRPEMVEFFSVRLASSVFDKALDVYPKKLDTTLLIEEAHNLLSNPQGIFYRLAKEGKKYGIGMLYSTQSPSSIPNEILSQTENFFIKHVSSEGDIRALDKAKVAFDEPVASFILSEPVVAVSYVYMEPYQPFPVPVKIKLLEDIVKELGETTNQSGESSDQSNVGSESVFKDFQEIFGKPDESDDDEDLPF
jgi:hypothetical protein